MAEEIIRQLAANQDEAANVRDRYIYRKIVQLSEIGDDGKPAGQAEVTTEFAAQDDGTRRPKTSRKTRLRAASGKSRARRAVNAFGDSVFSVYDRTTCEV